MPEDQEATAKKPATKKTAAKKAAPKEPTQPAPAKSAAEKQPVAKKAAAEKPVGKPASDKAVEPEPVEQPVAEQSAAAKPLAENPLHRKLGLRPGTAGVVIAAPDKDDNPLLPLPEGFSALAQPDELASHEGPFDYIHVFARDRGDLAGAFAMLRDRLAPGGSLWISWMKQSSGRGSGMVGDLNENVIRKIALTNAMVDVKVAALDRTWSALKVVLRREHRLSRS
jgi:hypothetical protein